MGFGAARAGSVPGMVLVGLVSEIHAAGVKGAAAGGVDAVMVSGVNDSAQLKDLATSLAGIPWGTCCVKLTEDESQTCQDSGGDLVAFALEGTTAAAITGEADLARILSVASNLEDSELRAISGLPVDALVPGYERCFRPVDPARPGQRGGEQPADGQVHPGAGIQRTGRERPGSPARYGRKRPDSGPERRQPGSFGRSQSRALGNASVPFPASGPDAGHRARHGLFCPPQTPEREDDDDDDDDYE